MSTPQGDAITTEPIKVHAVNLPEPKTYECRSSYRTAVLTALNPTVNIAGYDPLRERIRFSPAQNDYVISGGISQAEDQLNLVTPYANPNGRLVPALTNAEVICEGQNEVWLSASVYPTMVGYEIVRKVPT